MLLRVARSSKYGTIATTAEATAMAIAGGKILGSAGICGSSFPPRRGLRAGPLPQVAEGALGDHCHQSNRPQPKARGQPARDVGRATSAARLPLAKSP